MKVLVSTLDGRERREYFGHNAWIYALAFAPEGRLLAADGDGRLNRWDLDSAECELVFDSEVNAVLHTLSLDSAGTRAAISGYSGAIELVDLERKALIRQLEGHVATVDALAFCHGDRLLASAGRDRSLRLWSVESGEQLACIELDAPLSRVCCVGDRLLVGDVVGNLMVFEVDWSELKG
jgi:WD40 repeat protein